jgi:hypothetical protein
MTESQNKADLQAFFVAHAKCGDRHWHHHLTAENVTMDCVCGESISRTFAPGTRMHAIAFPGTAPGDFDYLIIGAKNEADARERARKLAHAL